ncbi:MAG: Smr/MutS family protein [Novosphingobium sp.]|nr:Smr/MutS family protein [Novosphingobium sp.]
MRSRKLSREEAQLWAQVARTVKPIGGRIPPRNGEGDRREAGVEGYARVVPTPQDHSHVPLHHAAHSPPPRAGEEKRQLTQHGLDASWDKKLARATLHPDFTLDLHGHSLDAAHARLDHGLAQATALGARLVLVITGLPRPTEAADRGQRRGAIRAKIMDWIELGPHASRIAAVRPAHRRHGGAGALYLVMKKPR